MIKSFLVIDCTGKNDFISLKIDNKFFIKKLQTNLIKNETLALEIFNFFKLHKLKINENFSVFVNLGPGSFSGIRISLAVAKGLQLVKKVKILTYNNFLLDAAPYLKEEKKIISIQKTNNFYYFSEGNFNKSYNFSFPKRVDFNKLYNKDAITVIPLELINDDAIKNLEQNTIQISEFNLKNIDILINNNLVENKLIKPLYLS
jgi:tRNA A37 threonylcarbamoyladenosine modification protein TsaB|tara:strand:- start:2970 stop:3578 length:609 start_codon:yes stop_codon:yes gene_type:complete